MPPRKSALKYGNPLALTDCAHVCDRKRGSRFISKEAIEDSSSDDGGNASCTDDELNEATPPPVTPRRGRKRAVASPTQDSPSPAPLKKRAKGADKQETVVKMEPSSKKPAVIGADSDDGGTIDISSDEELPLSAQDKLKNKPSSSSVVQQKPASTAIESGEEDQKPSALPSPSKVEKRETLKLKSIHPTFTVVSSEPWLSTTSLKGPGVCEIMPNMGNFKSTVLDEAKHYNKLANLHQCAFRNWTGKDAVLTYNFDDIAELCPTNLSRIIDLIGLKTIGSRFVNPSRASPGVVQLGARNNTYAIIPGPPMDNPYIVFLSLIVVRQSNLISPITNGTKTYHAVQGILACIEYQRMAAFFGQVFRTDQMKCNMTEEEGLVFSTFPSPPPSNSAPSSPSKGSPSKLPFSQRMIKASVGPLTNTSVRATDNPKSALGFEQRVPVFDGTGVSGAYDPATMIADMSLPQWHDSQQELPVNSLVLVAYTASHFASSSAYASAMPNISLNLQWLLMLEESIE